MGTDAYKLNFEKILPRKFEAGWSGQVAVPSTRKRLVFSAAFYFLDGTLAPGIGVCPVGAARSLWLNRRTTQETAIRVGIHLMGYEREQFSQCPSVFLRGGCIRRGW